MKSLQTIQKTFRVFQVLTKIAMILSFVWAGLAALGLLCGIVWYNGGTVVGADQEMMFSLTVTGGLSEMICVLLVDTILALTDGTLLLYALHYFKSEQADGTPFTESGADRLRRLGIHCIWLPIVAVVIAAVITACLGVEKGGDFSDLPSVVTGIVLILASLIFRYGAELEGQIRCLISDREKREDPGFEENR